MNLNIRVARPRDYKRGFFDDSSIVGLTPHITDQEAERLATQGDTGSLLMKAPDEQNIAALNGERLSGYGERDNSPVMWRNDSTGETITQDEYEQFVRHSEMTQGLGRDEVDDWLVSLGYHKVDYSNAQAPNITDWLNGSRPEDIEAEVGSLNGYNELYGRGIF